MAWHQGMRVFQGLVPSPSDKHMLTTQLDPLA